MFANLVRLLLTAAATVTVGYTWTVGQSGLRQTNSNLCELWNTLPLPPYPSCEFQYALPVVWAVVFVLFAGWMFVELFRLVNRLTARRNRLLAYSLLTVVFLIGSTVSMVYLVAEYRRPSVDARDDNAIRKTPFFFSSYIYVESREVKTVWNKDTGLYENTYYLGVGNEEPTGKTLRKVQVRLFGYDLATQATIMASESETEADIRHGEVTYFKIGRLITRQFHGMPRGSVTLDEKEVQTYAHNIGLNSLSFEIWNSERKRQFGLNSSPHMEKPSSWPLGILVSADDTKSVRIGLQIDFGNKERLVSIAEVTASGDKN